MRRGLALLVVFGALAASAGQARERSPGGGDLDGLWTHASMTQLERPPSLVGLVTPDEVAGAFERSHNRQPQIPADSVGQGDTEWWDLGEGLGRIDGRARSSWIVDPEDGRLPFTEEGLKRVQAHQAMMLARFDGPEARPGPERCLSALGGAPAPPLLNTAYNNHVQIVQTSDHVVIITEMNHDARIVPLTPAPRPPGVSWLGHSQGRWEGRTLVVETSGFHPGGAWRMPTRLYVSPDAVVTERFTRVSADELLYSFTVDDPAIYTRRWRAELPLRRAKGPMFEYACHEANYALSGVLAGARRAEQEGRPEGR